MLETEEAIMYQGPEGTIRIENFYTPLEEAKEEIKRRWNDKDLRKKVEEFLGDVPGVFQEELQAILFRNIATPDFEFQHAQNLAKKLDIKPLYLEYLSDKFCTRSLDKLYLGKMAFFHCRDKNGGCVVSKRKLFDLKKNDGLLFDKVVTDSGKNIIDFHHDLFNPLYPNVNVYDISRWIKKKGRNALENYPFFIALFLCHGVLLETYNMRSSEERKFAEKIVIPSFNKIFKMFGIKPLIVQLFNDKEVSDLYWYCHPQFLLQFIDKQ